MLFTVAIKNRNTGRCHNMNVLASDFETCLKKIFSLYGMDLVSITYDVRKNSGRVNDAVS